VACNHKPNGDIRTPKDGGMKPLLMAKVYNLYRVKHVMTIVLTIKSAIDPHMIR
jgi:hypothetical protein